MMIRPRRRAAGAAMAMALGAAAALWPAESAHARQETLTPEQQQARTKFIEALRLTESDKFEQARAVALEGARLDPVNADGLNLLGQIHEQLGQPEQAVEVYSRAVRADPEWALPLQNLGVLYLRQEQFAAALAPLERASELAPDDPRLYAYLGVALRAADRPAEAARAFESAWELDPDDGNLAIDVALSRAAAGDPIGAIEAAKAATELAPDNLIAHTVLARLLASSRDPDHLLRAPAAYRKAIALAPDNAALWSALASTYDTIALYEHAEKAQRRAIDLGLDTAQAWYRLGQMVGRQNRHADAVELFSQALERDPEIGWAYYSRGEANYNLNRPDEALGDLLQAVARLPGTAEPLLALVNVYMVKGDFASADRHIETARATGQDRPRVDLASARLRLRQGRNEEALEALERVRAAAPDLIEAQYLMGQVLIKLGRIEEGRALLADYQQKLNEQKHQQVDALRIDVVGRGRTYLLRARVFLYEGRLELALEQLQAASEFAPDNPEVWELLIQLHEQRGDAEALETARERLARISQRGA